MFKYTALVIKTSVYISKKWVGLGSYEMGGVVDGVLTFTPT